MVSSFQPGNYSCLDDDAICRIAAELEDRPPQEVITWALQNLRPAAVVIFTSFQVDGMAILDMALRIDRSVRVATVDTGRLPAATYDLIDIVREKYQVPVEVYYPDATELAGFVRDNGVNAFYHSLPLRLRCCAIRKVNPLNRALVGLDGWITGLRRDQSTIRSSVSKIEIDREHGGILKMNPLAGWTEADVWLYLKANAVPYNALYDHGYASFGCAPCTRPTARGEDARSGRWWWETNAPKECGIHFSIATGRFQRDAKEVERT